MLSRRELLGLFRPRSTATTRPEPPRDWLPPYCRPPGAAPELARLCDGCGACLEACPENVIVKLGPAYGELEGTPALLPDSGPCHLCPGLPCAAACETGALEVIDPSAARIGRARWTPERCWVALGQPCDYCVVACPLPEPAIAIADGQVRVAADRCTGCGLCVHLCTATPAALSIEKPA